jgi:hypothetical protein
LKHFSTFPSGNKSVGFINANVSATLCIAAVYRPKHDCLCPIGAEFLWWPHGIFFKFIGNGDISMYFRSVATVVPWICSISVGKSNGELLY